MPDSFTARTGREGLFEARLVRLDGKLSLELVLRELADQIDDFRLWAAGVAEAFYEVEQRQFATEGRHGGFPWQELSPEYARRKAQSHPGRGILERSGRMKASLTEPPRGGFVGRALRTIFSGDKVLRIDKDELQVGSSVEYSAYHHDGTKRGLPRRPPMAGPENYVLVMTERGVESLRDVVEDVVSR